MNTPSPLIPQGSLLEQKNQSRSRVKMAFFCVVGLHVAAILVALLAQGCKREVPPNPPVTEAAQPPVPVAETNLPAFEPSTAVATVESNTASQIPIGNVGTPATPAQTTTPPEPVASASQEYQIQKGDSFYTIGKKFNVSTKAIQEANPALNPNRLQPGQKITIPAPTAPSGVSAPAPTGGDQIYVVKAGDNLTKIAAQHGVTVNALRRANNLTTDRIKAGDKLKIPPPAAR